VHAGQRLEPAGEDEVGEPASVVEASVARSLGRSPVSLRRPRADAQRLVRNYLSRTDSAESARREPAWALLMTSEFSLNH
jgi:hypothetical protein